MCFWVRGTRYALLCINALIFLLRYLLKDDEGLYRKAEGFFQEVFAGKRIAYIVQAVVAEAVYVFAKVYGVPKGEVAGTLLELLSRKGIRIQGGEVTLEALGLYGARHLDFVDCLLCAYGKKFDIASFDRGVMKQLERVEEM